MRARESSARLPSDRDAPARRAVNASMDRTYSSRARLLSPPPPSPVTPAHKPSANCTVHSHFAHSCRRPPQSAPPPPPCRRCMRRGAEGYFSAGKGRDRGEGMFGGAGGVRRRVPSRNTIGEDGVQVSRCKGTRDSRGGAGGIQGEAKANTGRRGTPAAARTRVRHRKSRNVMC